jgi:hypothetical protein
VAVGAGDAVDLPLASRPGGVGRVGREAEREENRAGLLLRGGRGGRRRGPDQ